MSSAEVRGKARGRASPCALPCSHQGGGGNPAPANGHLGNKCGPHTRGGHHTALNMKKTLTGHTVDEPWEHYSKCKKPDAEDYGLYGSIYRERPGQTRPHGHQRWWLSWVGEGEEPSLEGSGRPFGGGECLQLGGGRRRPHHTGDALGAAALLLAVQHEFYFNGNRRKLLCLKPSSFHLARGEMGP